MSMTSQNHYSWLWNHQIIQSKSRKWKCGVGHIHFDKSEPYKTDNLRKTRPRKWSRFVWSILENIEYAINIFKSITEMLVFSVQLKESLPRAPTSRPSNYLYFPPPLPRKLIRLTLTPRPHNLFGLYSPPLTCSIGGRWSPGPNSMCLQTCTGTWESEALYMFTSFL